MIRREFLKYVAIGLCTNLLLFILYLNLTSRGIGHLQAMTMAYILGVLISFVLNRNWTFANKGHWSPALLRYAAAYAFGYCFNFCMLYLLANVMSFPHQLVQGGLILITAVFLFLLQKYWVFRDFLKT